MQWYGWQTNYYDIDDENDHNDGVDVVDADDDVVDDDVVDDDVVDDDGGNDDDGDDDDGLCSALCLRHSSGRSLPPLLLLTPHRG